MAKIKSRNVLIALAVLLVVLNVGRLANDKYAESVDAIESKQALLGQYQISTQNIDFLRRRIKHLEEQKRKFDAFLFTGASRKEVTSEMQIKLQEIISSSGLNAESLRPNNKSSKEDDKYYGEVIVKIRVTGSQEDLMKFLSSLYRLNYLFKIENFTLKPFKKTELKVFLELKGFYRLIGGQE